MVVLMDAAKAKIIRLNVAHALRHGDTSITCLGHTLTIEAAEAVLAHWKKVNE